MCSYTLSLEAVVIACATEQTPTADLAFARCPPTTAQRSPIDPSLALHIMPSHFSAAAKHHILLEYSPRSSSHSFAALARRHAVRGGERSIRRWHQRWDGSPASLQRKEGSGKTPTLTAAEVSRHVRAPILAANRAHRAISYPDLLPEVQRKTGKLLSLRSLRRYGKEELGARHRRGKKRTADESE